MKKPDRVFDEMDVVHCDMLLCMDRLDYEDVLKEVAMLDAMNQDGFYTLRVRQLATFCPSGTLQVSWRGLGLGLGLGYLRGF